MSLDVYLECPTCHHSKFSANITHNPGRMAQEAGVYEAMWRPEEIGATRARDIVGRLSLGRAMLLAHPDRFRALAPANGWGSYDDLVSFVQRYLAACEEHPDAIIRASR